MSNNEIKEGLGAFTDEELNVELSRRKTLQLESARVKAFARAHQITTGLTESMVDVLVPHHGRTSCNDVNLCNGFGHSDLTMPRCNRCALLEVARGYIGWPVDLDLQILLSKRSDVE